MTIQNRQKSNAKKNSHVLQILKVHDKRGRYDVEQKTSRIMTVIVSVTVNFKLHIYIVTKFQVS